VLLCASQVILVQSRQLAEAKEKESDADAEVFAILSSAALSVSTVLALAFVVQIQLASNAVFVSAMVDALTKTRRPPITNFIPFTIFLLFVLIKLYIDACLNEKKQYSVDFEFALHVVNEQQQQDESLQAELLIQD
jgi:hypothetical protein